MKRILYISPAPNPFMVQFGGAQRSNLLLKACVQVGEVDVICFADLPDDIQQDGFHLIYEHSVQSEEKRQSRASKFLNLFTAWCPEGQVAVDTAKERVIDEFVAKKQYDYIVTRYMNEAISMGLYKYADRLVVDIDDSPVDYARNGAKNAKTLRNKVYMSLYTKMTGIAMRTFIHEVAVSFFSNKHEADKYQSIFLPNIPFYDVEAQKVDRKHIKKGRLLFVGDLKHAPNYTGLDHFLNEIYPKINREVELHIVGRILDEERKEKWDAVNGVSVLGFVDDLAQEYAEAEVVIIPVYFGAGTCIKVLEAMQMRRVLVATPEGARGYEEYVSPNQEFLLARTDEEFVTSIQKALDNCTLQENLTSNASRAVERYFSKSAFYKVVKDAINK